jgi:hypothetical protein
MGMPFPVGLKLVHQNNDLLIPWAWGINGLFSVIGAVLAVIISVELSINSLIIFSFFSYFAALLIKFNKNYASPLS